MCTRYFRNAKSDRKLAEWVELDYVMNKKLEDTRGDVRPTDLAPVVCVSQRGKLFLQWQKWGFNDMGNGRLVLNARAESVPEKRMFSECMETRRCLVPAAGL